MSTESQKAIWRSEVYGALSLGFSPPDEQVQKKLISEEGRRRVSQLLAGLGLGGELDFRTGQRVLIERYEQLLGEADGSWVCGHAARLRSECAVMASLSRQEADALEKSDRASLEQTRRAEAAFLLEHLGRSAAEVGPRLERLDGDDFYGELGGLFRRFIEAECAALQVGSG